MTEMEDAQILWEYHQLNHEPRNTEIAIGLGSHDIGVAEHAADLWHEGRFPLIVFTGANAPTTVGFFPRGEAVHYAERAQELGVPREAILTEVKATNTGENFSLTRALLDSLGLNARSATLISRPYQQRRAFATARKIWPELDIVCSARTQPLDEYIESTGDFERVLNMLVGDTQRIWIYAQRGYAVPQSVPIAVRQAYERLATKGFDHRILPADPSRPAGLDVQDGAK